MSDERIEQEEYIEGNPEATDPFERARKHRPSMKVVDADTVNLDEVTFSKNFTSVKPPPKQKLVTFENPHVPGETYNFLVKGLTPSDNTAIAMSLVPKEELTSAFKEALRKGDPKTLEKLGDRFSNMSADNMLDTQYRTVVAGIIKPEDLTLEDVKNMPTDMVLQLYNIIAVDLLGEEDAITWFPETS